MVLDRAALGSVDSLMILYSISTRYVLNYNELTCLVQTSLRPYILDLPS